MIRRVLILIVLGMIFTTQAQTFPTKPVRIITPFPVGSGPEGVARLVADKLSKTWGQPVTVENRPGGNGFIAIDAFKRGATDGTDLIQLDNVHLTAYPYLFKKLPYDIKNDFEVLLRKHVKARKITEFPKEPPFYGPLRNLLLSLPPDDQDLSHKKVRRKNPEQNEPLSLPERVTQLEKEVTRLRSLLESHLQKSQELLV
jgi:hypothetical protein